MPSPALPQTLTRLFPVVRDRVLLGVNTLVPALASTLGSTNEKVRAEAQCAIDSLVASAEPALLVQNLCHVLANGGASRGRGVLVEKLQSIVPQVGVASWALGHAMGQIMRACASQA